MTTDEAPYWQRPVLDDHDRIVAGVAAGIAREIGIDPNVIRVGFVLLFATGGWGAVLYGAAWAAMALAPHLGAIPTSPPVAKGRSAQRRFIGVGLVFVGLVLLSTRIGGFTSDLVWPFALLGVGVVVTWSRLTGGDPETGPWSNVNRWTAVAIGTTLTLFALGWVANRVLATESAAEGTLLALGAVAVVGALSAPWWWRLIRERDAERQARVRSDERAEVAAHLHDSVLQTLSLIQRHDDDPQAMINLARRQERELRNWLDPDRMSRRGGSMRGRLDELASEVEELHGTPVEVVAVGDCLVDDRVESLLGAANEAAVNAAKHSGADRIDLYLEVTPESVEIFVRDTGKGFDPEAIDSDRRGVRNSIEGRMARAGGTAVIITAPGEGTEVELQLSRDNPEADPSDPGPGTDTEDPQP